MMPQKPGIEVQFIDPDSPSKTRLAGQICDLVNVAYSEAISNLMEAPVRTSRSEVLDMMAAGELATASSAQQIIGVIRIRDLDADKSELSMITASLDSRGKGVGTALFSFAERVAQERGQSWIRLQLLAPRVEVDTGRQFLENWYGRRGYHRLRRDAFKDHYPSLAPLLTVPCDLIIFHKSLEAAIFHKG